MKDYDKNKESSYLKYQDVNNLHGRTKLQKLPAINLEWIEDTSQFNEDIIKTIIKKVMKDNFSTLIFNILKKLNELHNDLPF